MYSCNSKIDRKAIRVDNRSYVKADSWQRQLYYNNTLLYLYNPKILHCIISLLFSIFQCYILRTVPDVVTVRCTRCHYIPRPATNNITRFSFVFNKLLLGI